MRSEMPMTTRIVVLDEQDGDAQLVPEATDEGGRLGVSAGFMPGGRLIEQQERGRVARARAISSRRWSP